MSIDQSYTVDTALAAVPVTDLMTKAFELTHQIHEATDHGSGRSVVTLREQRDVIVREMQRRSDGMERALVRVEAAERIMRGVDATLGGADLNGEPDSVADVEGRITYCRSALNDMMHETTVITCSLVKDQSLSDRITKAARDIVKPIKDAAAEVGKFGPRLRD